MAKTNSDKKNVNKQNKDSLKNKSNNGQKNLKRKNRDNLKKQTNKGPKELYHAISISRFIRVCSL